MAVVKSWFENNMTRFDTIRFSKCYEDGTKSAMDFKDLKVNIRAMRTQSNGIFIDTSSNFASHLWKTYCYLIENDPDNKMNALYLEMFDSKELESKPRLNNQNQDLSCLIRCDVESIKVETMGNDLYLNEFYNRLEEMANAPGTFEDGDEPWQRLRRFESGQNHKGHLYSELENDERFEDLIDQGYLKCSLYNIQPGILCGQNIKQCIKDAKIKLFIY